MIHCHCHHHHHHHPPPHIIKLIVQIGLLGAGIVAMFQLVGLNKLIGLLPLAYGDI